MTDAGGGQAASGGQGTAGGTASASIGLIVVVLIVMGGAMLIASSLGLGSSEMIAGFTAIFFAIGVGGGGLRADLRKIAWYGPLTALSASVPRIVADDHLWAGLALVCVIVFVAGLLPVLGLNYTQAGMGLGIATLLAFAMQAPVGGPGQTVAAAFVGVGFVTALRVLMKWRDPSDVTRRLVAGTLTGLDPGFEPAYVMWLRDRPVQWLGRVLEAAMSYQLAASTLTGRDAQAAAERAGQVAALVTARQVTDEADAPAGADGNGTTEGSGREAEGALRHALGALDRAATAARTRDGTVVERASATRRALTMAQLRAAITWQSSVLRHAVRTMLGVLATFLVAWATVGPRDPLVVSMATASFAMLQIGWTQSLRKAKDRIVGVAGGAAVMALALWILPSAWLLPLALVGAAGGLWFIATSQVWSIGCFVTVSVGMNAITRGLNPGHTLIEYVLLLASAVVIGLLLGFVVVPYAGPSPAAGRVQAARNAAASLVTAARDCERRPGCTPRELVSSWQRLLTATANLRSPLSSDDERAGIDPAACGLLATRLEALAVITASRTGTDRATRRTLSRTAAILAGQTGLDTTTEEQVDDLERLASWLAAGSDSVLDRPNSTRSHGH